METHAQLVIDFFETAAGKALNSAPIDHLNNEMAGWRAPDRRLAADDGSAVIGTHLNAVIDPDLLARMRKLTHRGMIVPPRIADEQVAQHPAATTNCEDRAQPVSARRITHQSPTRAPVAWVLATLAIVGLLTTMLMVGIAISV
jgi:hypothetical protein